MAPDATARLKLLTWLSPSFPVGAYAFSHGLEWAVEDGTVRRAADCAAWIAGILRHGAGRNDAILLAHAWRATSPLRSSPQERGPRSQDDGTGRGALGPRFRGDEREEGLQPMEALPGLIELAAALQPSRERLLETVTQGRAFLAAISAAWANERFDATIAEIAPDQPVPYPIAVAIAAACHGLPLDDVAPAYLHAFAANLVSVALRAVPLGQTDGQRILAELMPIVEEIAAEAMSASLDDLGGATFLADIASMKHETQYTRLFRS